MAFLPPLTSPRSSFPASGERGSPRLSAIDRLRGVVILLMALDHMRDFFDADALRFSPTDLAHTYPALFLTRFITHFCAPAFELLAGVSAFLHGQKLESRAALSRFLFTRGLWLIFLDAVLVSPVWGPGSGRIELGALWAIGCGMVALAGLCWLRASVVLALGLAIVFGHNLLDGVHAADFGAWAPLWRLLHEPGPLPFGLPGGVLYPALPWIGIISIGYGLGPLFLVSPERRARALTLAGLAALTLFVVLRAANFYGDPKPWTVQADAVTTALSFLNVTKYPPSLLYALVTLGPALILLPRLERPLGKAGDILETFGRAALFAYLAHLYAGLAAAGALALARGFTPAQIGEFIAKGAPPENFGVGLSGAYLAWIAVMTALYPACRWYAQLKRRRKNSWLSYL